nr:MAG TPA: hypothetical protein [Caudoviricetes sp.]
MGICRLDPPQPIRCHGYMSGSLSLQIPVGAYDMYAKAYK